MKRASHLRRQLAGLAAAFILAGMRAGGGEVAPSTSPPGGLAPGDAPQIVVLTFDDAVTTASFSRVEQVLSGFANPNGQAIKATFFVAVNYEYDPVCIRRLYEAGHEIAVHTMSHETCATCSVVRWRQEIVGAQRTLSRLCAIPAEDIVGFRTPFLAPNDGVFRVLAERQFRYDATFRESVGGLSTAPTNMLWPYTLDHGLKQVAKAEESPATNYPGLFEIPMWVQFTNGAAAATTDPPEGFSSNAVVELWQTNFLSHYAGNRAPYGIFLHATMSDQWLASPEHSAWRIGALRTFIGWALAHTDTWFVTCRNLTDFMLDPAPAAEAAARPPFLTPSRAPFPSSEVSRCTYPGSYMLNVCGSCPPAAPNYTNAYLGFVPMAGGAMTLNVVSQDAKHAWCNFVVSNDVPQLIFNWSGSFALTGGALEALYNAFWAQDGELVTVDAKQYNRQLKPGAALEITFRVKRDGSEVTLGEASLMAFGLGPQPIWMKIEQQPDPAAWLLSWDDNAYLYRVECATNLFGAQEWEAVTNELCQPAIAAPPSADGAPRFYRVQGTLY